MVCAETDWASSAVPGLCLWVEPCPTRLCLQCRLGQCGGLWPHHGKERFWDFGKCLSNQKDWSRPNLCLQWKKWKNWWAVSTGVPPLLPPANPVPMPCPSHACSTSGSCKSLQPHLFQWDSAASGGVCNRNFGITCFPNASWSQREAVLLQHGWNGWRQLHGDMTSRNSLKNPLNKGMSFMKVFTSPVLHVLFHLLFASYLMLNWLFRMSLGGFWKRKGKSNSCLLELLAEWPEGQPNCASLWGRTKRGQGKPFKQPVPGSSGWNEF